MAYQIIASQDTDAVYPETELRPRITAVLDSAEDVEALGGTEKWSPGSLAILAEAGFPTLILSASRGWINGNTGGAVDGSGSLPEGASPNQYLITDSEGVAGWAERLAWKDKVEHTVIEEQAVSFIGDPGLYKATVKTNSNKLFSDNDVEASVFINGEEFIWPSPFQTSVVTMPDGTEFAILAFLGNFMISSASDDLPPPVVVEVISKTISIKSINPQFLPDGIPYSEIVEVTHIQEQIVTLSEDTDENDQARYIGTAKLQTPITKVSEDGVEPTILITVDGKNFDGTFTESGVTLIPKAAAEDDYFEIWLDADDLAEDEVEVRYIQNRGSVTLKVVSYPTVSHPLPPSLGGMPTLAEDGSDAGKFVMANADGTGYELVSMTNVAEEGA